jgi:hypothetical protein
VANLFYPHGIYVLGSTFLGQADDIRLDSNVDKLQVHATGDTMPGFTGGRKTEPEFKLPTMDLYNVFTLVNSGDEALCRDLSSGNVDLMFRQAKNLATREAVGSSKHVIYRLIQSAMMIWDSFEVSQDAEAKIETRFVPCYSSSQATVTLLKEQTIQAASAITKLYTIGKVVINGTTVNRVKKIAWNNNATVEKESADGQTEAAHVCVGKCNPEVTVDTQELEQIQAFTSQGTALDGSDGLEIYLRRRQQGKINYADNASQHIKLKATTGSVWHDGTQGEKATGSLKVFLQRPSNGGAVWTITTGVTIP